MNCRNCNTSVKTSKAGLTWCNLNATFVLRNWDVLEFHRRTVQWKSWIGFLSSYGFGDTETIKNLICNLQLIAWKLHESKAGLVFLLPLSPKWPKHLWGLKFDTVIHQHQGLSTTHFSYRGLKALLCCQKHNMGLFQLYCIWWWFHLFVSRYCWISALISSLTSSALWDLCDFVWITGH